MASEIDALCAFIRNEIGYDGALTADMDLLETRVLDSFNIVQLAMFVQQQFGLELETEDLVRVNLSTLTNILALISRKRAAAS